MKVMHTLQHEPNTAHRSNKICKILDKLRLFTTSVDFIANSSPHVWMMYMYPLHNQVKTVGGERDCGCRQNCGEELTNEET